MTNEITIESDKKTDFRAPTVSKNLPRAVADAANGGFLGEDQDYV